MSRQHAELWMKAAAEKLSERESERGDIELGMSNLGKIWAGIIGDWLGEPIPPLPPSVVGFMMVGLKAGRAVRKTAKDHDDALDMLNYAAAAAHCHWPEVNPTYNPNSNARQPPDFTSDADHMRYLTEWLVEASVGEECDTPLGFREVDECVRKLRESDGIVVILNVKPSSVTLGHLHITIASKEDKGDEDDDEDTRDPYTRLYDFFKEGEIGERHCTILDRQNIKNCFGKVRHGHGLRKIAYRIDALNKRQNEHQQYQVTLISKKGS